MSDTAEWIQVRGAREHNLRNFHIDLPRGRLTVITGPSGSGKSSLAFDTLFAEGQRRYLETLRLDARAWFDQLQRPDVDAIEGLPPTLAVEQHAGSARPRSTLATLTEIHDHLRLLWARLGTPFCYQCGAPIQKQATAEIVRQTLTLEDGRKVLVLAPVVRGRKGEHKEVFQEIRKAGFLRARVNGVLTEIRDIPRLNPRQSHTVEVVVDRLVIRDGIQARLTESIETAVKHGQGVVLITQIDDGDWHDRLFNTQYACANCQISYGSLEPRDFSFNNLHGACPRCDGLGQVWELGPELREQLEEAKTEEDKEEALALADAVPCPECGGARLKREARSVRFAGKALHEATALTVDQAIIFFESGRTPTGGRTDLQSVHEPGRTDLQSVHEPGRTDCKSVLLATPTRSVEPAGNGQAADDPKEHVRALLLTEILRRLRFLQEVGLGYLTLDRPAPTLSGGEAQRARLATHLGAGLLGVCYILDEPTVGLHPRDTARLLAALRGLQERGNTVLVVEHDEEVIRHADYLVDIGPGAGKHGGRLVARGTVAEVLESPDSLTAQYLRGHPPAERPRLTRKQVLAKPALTIRGARHHNLKGIEVAVPLGCLVCLTGVSGSGKSSLARDTLCYAARRHLGQTAPRPGAYDRIDGLERIDKVIEVDQSPLGRSPRSSAATYTGVFDEVRKIFAATRESKVRGYKASRFSFNVRGGRCEECQGQGSKRVALHFLPDLTVPCPVCRGRRFNRATLEIRYRDRSIADVLDLSVEAALDFFANFPAVVRPLRALADVGVGYLTLGQPASHLSGGEAQRVKLAAELARTATGQTLFLLDEPTTGLHFADVDTLLRAIGRLVEPGNTVLVIEHNLDVIAAADWVIDLGPEGGDAGGYVDVAGTPADVAACPASLTGRYLARRLHQAV
jgi:excinuclease ABC subunit A